MKGRTSRPSCVSLNRTLLPLRLAHTPTPKGVRSTVEGSGGSRRSGPVAPLFAGQIPERHLLLAVLSAEHRRGLFWETVGFLAIWLSGLIGVAICVL